MKTPLTFLLLLVVMTTLTSATITCDQNSISNNYTQHTQAPSKSISCSNDANSSVTISKTGNFFSITESTIGASPSQKTININFDSNFTHGIHFGTIDFSSGDSVNVVAFIEEPPQQPNSQIIVFPTNSVTTVQQNQQKSKNIVVTVPSTYPRTITIQSVDFNPGTETIKFGDLNLGQVAPGQSVNIPILFDAKDAQVGTYETNLNIFAIDSNGQIPLPTINLQLQVSTGVSPVDTTSFSTRPSCSLSATTLNVNQTATFTCAGVVNNIDVTPQYNEFFQGISVDVTSNIFTYTFKPVKFGITDFTSLFNYRGVPIFEPFRQEVRISSTSGQVAGTSLKFLFTPSLDVAQNGETIAIQLLDNKTDSLVENPSIDINAIPITNRSGNTFFYEFEAGKNYSIRGYTAGYQDIQKEISLLNNPIEITITPEEGNSNTFFTITTDVNATIFVDGTDRGEQYSGTLTAGEHEIKAQKDGHSTTTKNITVGTSVSFFTSGEFKKDVIQIYDLNKNASWEVYYQEDDEATEELLLSGNSNQIQFTPEKSGKYILKSEGSIRTETVEGFTWDTKWWFMTWYWWVLILVVILGIYFYSKNGGSVTQVTPYS